MSVAYKNHDYDTIIIGVNFPVNFFACYFTVLFLFSFLILLWFTHVFNDN